MDAGEGVRHRESGHEGDEFSNENRGSTTLGIAFISLVIIIAIAVLAIVLL